MLTTNMPTRHNFLLPIGKIRRLRELGVICPAPENRNVLENRPRGTCEGYWNSIRKGINPGQMLTYSPDECNTFANLIKVGDYDRLKLFVTDFGHRLNWLTRDSQDIVFNDGHTLASLEIENNQAYSDLMNILIPVSVSTHPDKDFLKNFIKEEYLMVNTMSTPLEGGELARGLPDNPTRLEPEALAKKLIATYYPNTSSERDELTLLGIGLVSAIAKGLDNFHRKVTGEYNILDVAKEPLTESETANVIKVLNTWNKAETELLESLEHIPSPQLSVAEEAVKQAKESLNAAGRAEKPAVRMRLKELEKDLKVLQKEDKEDAKEQTAQKKLLQSRIFDHKNCGPILYGFREAILKDIQRNDGLSTELDNAKDIYKRWLELSLGSKAVWKENHKDVASKYGDNNSARYYNEIRFKAGWTRMKTMLPEE
jgi:hypothetical protein